MSFKLMAGMVRAGAEPIRVMRAERLARRSCPLRRQALVAGRPQANDSEEQHASLA